MCASVLLYVMTRDKLCTNLGEGGVNLLVGMLATPTCDQDQLEGREARDWQKVHDQARYVYCVYVCMCTVCMCMHLLMIDRVYLQVCMYV